MISYSVASVTTSQVNAMSLPKATAVTLTGVGKSVLTLYDSLHKLVPPVFRVLILNVWLVLGV